MGIHNQIWTNATLRENEILLLNNGTTYTFLPMSAAELVTDLEDIMSQWSELIV